MEEDYRPPSLAKLARDDYERKTERNRPRRRLEHLDEKDDFEGSYD